MGLQVIAPSGSDDVCLSAGLLLEHALAVDSADELSPNREQL
jgi:hypothetical protein